VTPDSTAWYGRSRGYILGVYVGLVLSGATLVYTIIGIGMVYLG
jgi:hypothetical protein